ncbi:MAG: DUF3501 family protein [Acidimicrobiales bacterium]
MAKLTLVDISDLRAYEREREEFRSRVISLKGFRRVHVGPMVTLVFENRDTIRFQVQEMARAEKMLSDGQIQTELDIYNPLIPEPGQLSATLFIELTSEAELREWLPKLVGIERSVCLRIGDEAIFARPEEGHAAQLTREETTASVHYIRFELTPGQVERFAREWVTLVVDHPEYLDAIRLGTDTTKALLGDLLGH